MQLFKVTLWSGGSAVKEWTATTFGFSQFNHSLTFSDYNTKTSVTITGTISIEVIKK